jgi:hypothetical protein
MVKLSSCASLLSLTLTTSFALAVPLHPRDLVERDGGEEFSRREYLLDASNDLAAREPSFFGNIENGFKEVGKVAAKGLDIANKGLDVADKIVNNPVVQVAADVIPGGSDILAAEKVIGAVRKFEKFENLANKAVKLTNMAKSARRTVDKFEQVEGTLRNGIRKGREVVQNVEKFDKAISRGASTYNSARPASHKAAGHRRHRRRDLEDNEELSRRDLDAEEFFGRGYVDFLAERDFFDDLD